MKADHLTLLLAFGAILSACGTSLAADADRSSLVPPRPAGTMNASTAVGAGVIVAGRDNASFNFDVKDLAPPGDVTVFGSVDGTGFRLKGRVDAVTITDGRMTASGTGTLNGVAASFTAQAQDGSPDAFAFAVTTEAARYELAGDLTRGDVTITPRR